MKVMTVFGTRPEAIKMAPIVKQLENYDNIETIVTVTGQHKEMLQQVLDLFDIKPKYNLKIMSEKQTLFDITIKILEKIKPVLEEEKPDIVLVHGDTSTTFVTSLACYYLQIPIGHVEAGLRTYDIYSPFPEEFNRQAVGLISQFNFAPTNTAKLNLLNEGKNEESIKVTGNTVIDALKTTVKKDYSNPILEWVGENKLILLTTHRRENIGEPMENIFKAIKRIVNSRDDVRVVFPAHKNPLVQKLAQEMLFEEENIKIIDPLDVFDFHNIIARSYLILTDSGGIQEEAPGLGVPVLVLRNTTERYEGIQAGVTKLVGTDEKIIYNTTLELLENSEEYKLMSNSSNPYGDGNASLKIVNYLVNWFKGEK